MRSLIFIIMTALIFAGCTKIPEKAYLDEKINEMISELEEERTAKCGNGIVEEWEECDFEGLVSCSHFDKTLIGKTQCINCAFDKSFCENKEQCNEEFCSSNGVCKETYYFDHGILCSCVNNRTGTNCEKCIDDYHFDLDGTCIPDNVCTLTGCESEKHTCEIIDGRAICICDEPWTGSNCDGCLPEYYSEDGKCISRYCSSGELICHYYEKCNDKSGKPVCVCKTPNQDSDDCSKCLPGYDWINTIDFCVNSREIRCEHDPAAPLNSTDIVSFSTITYTDENGWTEPDYCQWICHEGLMKDSGSCINPYIKQYTLNGYPYVAGFDESNNLLVIYVSSMYSVSKTEMKKISEFGSSFTGGIIGNDRNIYLRNKYGFGVYFRNSDEFLKISSSVTDSQNLSLLNSAVFFGNSYLDFPEINYINGEIIDENASSISDKDGNILTVYNNGTVKLNKSDLSIIWKKNYSEYLFSKNPVIDSQENVHIPCRNNSKSCILTIRLSNGSIVGKFEFPDSSEISHQPAISIGSNLKKYAVQGGVLTIIDKDNNILAETSKVVPKKLITNDFAPVVTDRGLTYFSNYESVVCVNEAGEQIWIQDTDNIVYSFFHHDNTLYVFNGSGVYLYNAPGNISGDWPHFKHDARLSNSLLENEFVDPPSAPVALSPEDSTVFNTNSVTFSWAIDSGDPEIKYTLLLRDSAGYDEVYAGPEIGLTTAIVSDLAAGSYEWRVVSKDKNGSLNVSDARTFEIE